MASSELEINENMFGKPVTVVCKDGEVITGVLVDHTSELDNEPDGESIMLETKEYPFLEIYIDEISKITP